MTLEDIRALVLSADPQAMRYESADDSADGYTVWHEYQRLPAMSDDSHDEGWKFQIDRFTTIEDDPVAAAIYAALDQDERVAFEYLIDYEEDTRTIHHIFDCEGY